MRSVPEWRGKSDDDRVPDRVRLRIFARFGGRCGCGCDRFIYVGESWDADHIIALINGGQHRESNLRPVLREHHKIKSRQDVALKAKIYAGRKQHLGLKRPKRPIPGSRASGWKRKMDGTVVKR